ncbi:MAG: hypothetical protein ACRCVX_06120, partial [Shewanella sp.]
LTSHCLGWSITQKTSNHLSKSTATQRRSATAFVVPRADTHRVSMACSDDAIVNRTVKTA